MIQQPSIFSRMTHGMMTFMMRFLPSCEDAARMASERLDSPLGLGKRMGLRIHLSMCKWCRDYERQLKQVHLTIRRTVDQDDPNLMPVAAKLSDSCRKRLEEICHTDDT